MVAPAFAIRMSHPSGIPVNHSELEQLEEELTTKKRFVKKKKNTKKRKRKSYNDNLADFVKELYSDNTVGSGTSYACPYVAACALVVWSRYPYFSPSAVKSALITTGTQKNDCYWDVS